jgi:hypothetical protein
MFIPIALSHSLAHILADIIGVLFIVGILAALVLLGYVAAYLFASVVPPVRVIVRVLAWLVGMPFRGLRRMHVMAIQPRPAGEEPMPRLPLMSPGEPFGRDINALRQRLDGLDMDDQEAVEEATRAVEAMTAEVEALTPPLRAEQRGQQGPQRQHPGPSRSQLVAQAINNRMSECCKPCSCSRAKNSATRAP